MKQILRFEFCTRIPRTLCIIGLLLCFPAKVILAQGEIDKICVISTQAEVGCDALTVTFSGNPTWPTHFWDFGDGNSVSGGSTLTSVSHVYVDINPYAIPILSAGHSLDNSFWCYKELQEFIPGIFLGTGCGSVRKVSEMVAANKLPANGLTGKNLYIFGNLEVDVPYTFDACSIFMSTGGKVTVKSGAALTLKNNTLVDRNLPTGAACQGLWNGIEVFSGSSLITNGATIQNAYLAIRPIKDNANSLPLLRLKNTHFKRNFVGVYATEGGFIMADFRNNTFEGSGNTPIYPLSTCNPANALPYAQRTYCGLYFNGLQGGSLLLPLKSENNLFKDLQAGIVCLNGTASIKGCRFENIAHLPNNTALHQGTAITFIDNLGKKSLTVTGLGRGGLSTVNDCERGIYAITSRRPSAVNISHCRMTEVQNGIEIGATGMGNFSKGSIKNNYIGCTKYFGIIKQRSTGIEWRDPNVMLSNFSITDNEIHVDQLEAYLSDDVDENILPTAINVVAMHNQTSNGAMQLTIGNNWIDLVKGHQGIVVENVTNAQVVNNTILHDNSLYGTPEYGVAVFGGFKNLLQCNTINQTNLNGSFIVGLYCNASSNVQSSQNTFNDMIVSSTFLNDNETNCRIAYNNFNQNFQPLFTSFGLYYFGSQTGPQFLQGNDWMGDFSFGALYDQDDGEFSYCNSLYHVSVGANVANATNPIDQGNQQTCAGTLEDWFTLLDLGEGDYICAQSSPPIGDIVKNEADLNLAGGGTLSLSQGYKWSSEMGLYRKFTEHPDLATGDAVISNFMQGLQGQPVAITHGVRNSLNEIENTVPAPLATDIKIVSNQLEANAINLLIFLENIGTDSSAVKSFTGLYVQTDSLEGVLENYLVSAMGSMSQSATAAKNTSDGITCSVLPCTTERYVNGLYLEAQSIAPRPLTNAELEQISQVGLLCAKEAGNVVYLARAWYYLETGNRLQVTCDSLNFPIDLGERNALSPKPSYTSGIVLMPNPADADVKVLLPTGLKAGVLTVHDVWGRALWQREVSADGDGALLAIPTQSLANGVYWVSFKEESGHYCVQKLAIAH